MATGGGDPSSAAGAILSNDWTKESENLILDFGHVSEANKWQRMPNCDEFVGPRRSKHTMVSYLNGIYVFGGDNGRSMLDDLLVFDVKEKSWSQAIVASGPSPSARYHHSAVVYGASMFIFGGYTGDIPSNSNLANRNDLWEYKFQSCNWVEWKTANNGSGGGQVKPVPRSAHGAAVYDGKLYVFAGYDGTARLNDMWTISLTPGEAKVWKEVVYSGESPPTCCNFPVAVAHDSMFVFSGQSGARITNSLYQFHFPTQTWTRISTEHILRDTPPAPNRRYGHTMVAYGRQLYVFGGYADTILSNDLHAFDLDSKSWSRVELAEKSQTPNARLFHSAAIVKDSMFVFGGALDHNIRSGEMYRFQFASFPKCTMQEDFGRLLTLEQFSDVTFVVGPPSVATEIRAHVALIAARCPYLLEKIRKAKIDTQNERPNTANPLIVELRDAENPRAFKLLLDFIYTDMIDPSSQMVKDSCVVLEMMHVLLLSMAFSMSHLEQLCVAYLENAITIRNVLVALKNASDLGLSFIKEFCLKFIIRESNCNEIIMSSEFESLDKELMVEIIRRSRQTQLRPNASRLSPSSGGPPANPIPPVPPQVGQQNHQQLAVPQPAAVVAVGASCRLSRPLSTHESAIRIPQPANSLREDMRRFLFSPNIAAEFSDVDLILENDVIPSHRAILAARSSYFEGMFRSFPPSDDRVPIAIGDVIPSRQSFKSLLRYIYFGDVSMPPEDSLYLFTAPHFFIFTNPRLQIFCKHNLERNVTVDNVIQILEAADKSQAHDMKRYALSLIVKHFEKVVRLPRLRNLSKELLLDILTALADEQMDRRFSIDYDMKSICLSPSSA